MKTAHLVVVQFFMAMMALAAGTANVSANSMGFAYADFGISAFCLCFAVWLGVQSFRAASRKSKKETVG
ncbi:hypothetical protein [Rhizobium sp. 11515TR]|uniref:hypothetical protein n=1 Tax=Rhizobium sp. 11515TR TaxID=2028343 RepID=UPI000BA85A29|nr:hypothetical protein [Rhizobium sp. 11515TR]ASW06328.1 hypothetical protein CKA34_10820 [Rhizobium sp. 11515TR]